MRFIFDENFPPYVARVIEALLEFSSDTAHSIASLGYRGLPDTELLAALAEGSEPFVLVTADAAMKRRKHEVAAIRDTGAIVVVCAKGWNQEADNLNRARMMVWWWDAVSFSAHSVTPGSFIALPWSGNPRALSRWTA